MTSCLTLCDPMHCSLPHSSILGISQARVLEWVAFPSPEGLPDPGIEPGSPTLQADSLPIELPGKPGHFMLTIINANPKEDEELTHEKKSIQCF